MKIPITQSKEWQKLQEDLGEKSFYIKEKGYEYLAILKTTPLGDYLYLPYGPLAESENSFNNALEELKNFSKENNIFFIRIEPINPNFVKILPKNSVKTTDLNPKETWVLDLTGTDEELKQKLPSRLLRYYKNAEKNGIRIEITKKPEDIKHLLKLQKALASKKGINTFSEEYLKTELSQPFSSLYLLKYKNLETNREEIIAAGLVFDHNETRYNLQGAQTENGRKLHATGILTIKLIKDAKEKGLKAFDFWGIAPEDAPDDHPWKGFTNFKKSFDGEEVDYAGTYDVILNSFKYRLYKLIRKLNRFIRHV